MQPIHVAVATSVLLATSAVAQTTPISFESSLPIDLGMSTILRPQVANFNGDDYPDILLTGNLGSTNDKVPVILLNNGDETFAAPQTIAGITGARVYALDMDADGLDDLVVHTAGLGVSDNFIEISLNSTPGGCTTPSCLDFGASPVRWTFTGSGGFEGIGGADLDGDGLTELVVWFFSGGLQVFDVDGSGLVLGTTPVFTLPLGVDVADRAMEIADIDVDGRLDIVTVSRRVLMNTTPASAGSPSFAVTVLANAGSFPRDIAVGDVDGDGRPDLVRALNANCCARPGVVVDRQSSGCEVLQAFDPPTTYAINRPFFGVEVQDLDGDGRGEVVLAESTSGFLGITIHRTDPAGELLTDMSGALVPDQPALGVGLFATADFDRNGSVDLFSAFGPDYQVHLNTTVPLLSERFAEAPLLAKPKIYVNQHSRAEVETGSADQPFRTVSAAITDAGAAGQAVILVSPGVYSVCSGETGHRLGVSAGIELIGVAGAERTILEDIGVDLDPGARLTGWTLRSRGNATSPIAPALVSCGDNVTVTQNIIDGFGADDGIRTGDSGGAIRIGSNIVGDCAAGIVLGTPDASAPPSMFSVYNNTLVGNVDGITFRAGDSVEIRQNIVVDSGGNGITHFCADGDPAALDVDFNLVEASATANYAVQGGCSSVLPLNGGPDRVPAPPAPWMWQDLFVDAATLDYHLALSSVALAAGDPSTPDWLGKDIDGHVRPTGGTGAPDLGADQFELVELAVEGVAPGGGAFTLSTGTDFRIKSSGLAPGTPNALFFATESGQLPVSFLATTFLVDPASIFFTASSAASPAGEATTDVDWGVPGPGIGFRLHLQAVALQGVELAASNQVVVTRTGM